MVQGESESYRGTGAARWPWGIPARPVRPEAQPEPPVDAADLAQTVCALVARGELDLPRPGRGRTLERFVALAELSAVDLSLGRLAEGHSDAVAILAEAGRAPPGAAVMGVWAARRAGTEVVATRHRSGWHLRGRKPWSSGARILTHALVTATIGDGVGLFEVPVDGGGVSAVPDTWPAVGMALSDSSDVEFDIVVAGDSLVGPPDWYVERPGFWFGSAGVAACWLGGAIGLVRALRLDLAGRQADPFQLAHLGAAVADCASMARDLAWAAGRIDCDPSDPARTAHQVALEVRHLVEAGCLEVLVRVGRAGGAAPLCQDRAQARRMADLPVYIRQHHAERDDEVLGRMVVSGSAES